ncbi:flagellar hook-length control protein FliK [Pantoea sp. A4]|uniref:flagellar hook-length control protein FliK n=1 Tax=Pantoea sp. A4 TaxID=1225184 RepID=UPI0003788566|nr:flagellar hook-length control protein FliK [Pantoea sp. A4]
MNLPVAHAGAEASLMLSGLETGVILPPSLMPGPQPAPVFTVAVEEWQPTVTGGESDLVAEDLPASDLQLQLIMQQWLPDSTPAVSIQNGIQVAESPFAVSGPVINTAQPVIAGSVMNTPERAADAPAIAAVTVPQPHTALPNALLPVAASSGEEPVYRASKILPTLVDKLPVEGKPQVISAAELSPVREPLITASAPVVLKHLTHEQSHQLRQSVGTHLQWQIDSHTQQARLKLTPESLGQLELVVQREPGKLQVVIHATQPDVMRQLQQLIPEMRSTLSEQNGMQVDVQVAQQQQSAPQQSLPQQESHAEGLGEAGSQRERASPGIWQDQSILRMV